MSDVKLGRLMAVLGLDKRQFERELKGVDRTLVKTGRHMQTVGKNLTRGLSLPLAAAGVAIAKVGADFDTSMTKIETLVGVNADTVNRWRKDILALGPAAGKGPKELADALFVVTSAGERGSAALDIVTRAAKASAAGLGETAEIARAVTASMQAYKDAGLTAAEATDVLVATVREGNLEAGDLAGSLGRVIGIASQMGVTFDQVGGFIATFTRLGVNAEEAVTSLRGILSTVSKPTNEAREQLAEFGLTIDDLRQSIKDKGLAQTLVDLVGVVGDNQDAMAAIIPNVRALSGVLGTAAAQGETFVDVSENIKNSQGILDEAFERTKETARFAFDQLIAAAKAAAVELANAGVLDFVKDLATWLSSLVKRFSALDPEMKKSIVIFAGVAAAIGPVLTALGLLLAAVGVIGAPLALTVAGIALFAAGLIAFGDDLDALLMKFGSFIKEGLDQLVKKWKETSAAVIGFAKDTYEGVKLWLLDKFTAIVEQIREKIEAVTGFFSDMFDAIVGNSIVPDLIDGIQAEFARLNDVMVDPAAQANDAVVEIFETGAQGTRSAYEGVFDDLWSTIHQGGKISFQNLGSDIVDIMTRAAGLIANQLIFQPQVAQPSGNFPFGVGTVLGPGGTINPGAATASGSGFGIPFSSGAGFNLGSIYPGGFAGGPSPIGGGGSGGSGGFGGGGVWGGAAAGAASIIAGIFGPGNDDKYDPLWDWGDLFRGRDKKNKLALLTTAVLNNNRFEGGYTVGSPFGFLGASQPRTAQVDDGFVKNVVNLILAFDERLAALLSPVEIVLASSGIQNANETIQVKWRKNFDDKIAKLAMDRTRDLLIGALQSETDKSGAQQIFKREFGDFKAKQKHLEPFFAATTEFLSERNALIALRDELLASAEPVNRYQVALDELSARFAVLTDNAERFGLAVDGVDAALVASTADLTTGFDDQIARQIALIVDPMGVALDDLANLQEARLRDAADFGADLVDVERLNALERQGILEQFASNATNAIQGMLDSLLSGSSSPLSPLTVLANAEERFEAARQAVQGGGADFGALVSSAEALLSASSTVFASSAQFFERFDFVVATLQNTVAQAPGFARGGSFTVAGPGGVDNVVPLFRATPGETVTITPPGQESGRSSSIAALQASAEQTDLLSEIAESMRSMEERLATQQSAIMRLAAKVAVG